MDVITLAQLNALKKSGGVGYSEGKNVTLTFDGNIGNRENLQMDEVYYFVKLSDDVFDSCKIEYATANVMGEQRTYQQDEINIRVSNDEDPNTLEIIGGNADAIAVIVKEGSYYLEVGLSVGTWIPVMLGSMYTTEIKFTNETIHTIDPKYLPSGGQGGTGIPHIEVTLDGSMELPSDFCSFLDDQLEKRQPFSCTVTMADGENFSIFGSVFFMEIAWIDGSIDSAIFSVTFNNMKFGFTKEDGAWVLLVEAA